MHSTRNHKCPKCSLQYECKGCQAEEGNNEIYCTPCMYEVVGATPGPLSDEEKAGLNRGQP